MVISSKAPGKQSNKRNYHVLNLPCTTLNEVPTILYKIYCLFTNKETGLSRSVQDYKIKGRTELRTQFYLTPVVLYLYKFQFPYP